MGRGLSELQKEILTVIGTNPYTRVRTLTEHFLATRSTGPETTKASLYRALARLETRGILERVRIAEGRHSVPAVELKDAEK